MNRNTQIGMLVAIAILAVGGWFAYDMYTTKNAPSVINPNGQTLNNTTPSSTYHVGETRYITPLTDVENIESIVSRALEAKTVTQHGKPVSYTVYTLKPTDAKSLSVSPIIFKVSFTRNSEPVSLYFPSHIAEINHVDEFIATDRGAELRCEKTAEECTYAIQFSIPPFEDPRYVDKISVQKLIPDSIQNRYKKIVEDFSKSLMKKGIANTYAITSLLGTDTGIRYEVSLKNDSISKVYVVSSDFAEGAGEGCPAGFTPKDVDLNASEEVLRAQVINPTDSEYTQGVGPYRAKYVVYSTKASVEGHNVFVIFADCSYASEKNNVHLLATDSQNTGYFISVNTTITDKNTPQAKIQSVIESSLVKTIFSAIP